MAFAENWVESDPDGSVITVSVLDDWIRKTKVAVRERMEGDAALNLTGLIDSGTWATGPVPKAGSARANAVTAANLGTVPLQDGRMTITTDTHRLYHMATGGYYELDYLSKAAGGTVSGALVLSAGLTGTSASFSGVVTGSSFSGGVAAASLTGTTLASNVVTSSLTSVGTLTSLSVSGSITGTLGTAAQPNITSVGTLTSLTVSGTVSIGTNATANTSQDFNGTVNGNKGSTFSELGTVVGRHFVAAQNMFLEATTFNFRRFTGSVVLATLDTNGNFAAIGTVSGTSFVGPVKSASSNITSVGTGVNTTATDLMSFTLPTLADGDTVEIIASFSITGVNNTKALAFLIGAGNMDQSNISSGTTGRSHWRITLTKSGTSVITTVLRTPDSLLTGTLITNRTDVVTLSGATIKFQGTTVASADEITQDSMIVRIFKA